MPNERRLYLQAIFEPKLHDNLAKDVLALELEFSEEPLGFLSGMEYEDRLSKLMWPTLETRRLFLSLVECYKIVLA